MIRSTALAVALACACAGLAAAQTMEEQNACKDDAFRICSHTIPDRERTFQCMIAQKDSLSPACRTAMAAHLPPDPEPKGMRRSKSTTRASGGSDQMAQGSQKSKKGPVDLAPPGR